MLRTCAVLALIALVAACSDSDNPQAKFDEPCELLTQATAEALVGEHVVKVSLLEAVEELDGAVPVSERAEVEGSGRRHCIYRTEGFSDPEFVALQLDLRLFESADAFKAAWSEGTSVEGLGLAAIYGESEDGQKVGFNVLLNKRGDSFSLGTIHADTSRDALLQVAGELVDRYNA